MKLYSSNFVEISLSDNNLVITNEWFKTTASMFDEQYKAEMLKFIEFVVLHKPKYHLIKSIDFLYIITIEMQEWTNNTIFPQLINAGIKKIAFLVSSEIISQLSIEQTLEENNASAFAIKYFDSENEAKKWLLEK